ncbi:MAG: hypothetical protein AAFZ58_06580 [Pseudomonadota bacterium]
MKYVFRALVVAGLLCLPLLAMPQEPSATVVLPLEYAAASAAAIQRRQPSVDTLDVDELQYVRDALEATLIW